MKNTLCPYLVKPLSSGFKVNEEHILPVALGAPMNFSVPASLEQNQYWNRVIDAPMINDPIVKMLATIADVKSRSGEVFGTLQGTTEFGGKFHAKVTRSTVSPKFTNPIITNPVSKEIIGVKGFGNDLEKNISKLMENLTKKGRTIDLKQAAIINGSQDLEMSVEGDLLLIRREAIKIGYLMTVRVFGNHAIESKNGEIFRAALNAKNAIELMQSGLVMSVLPPDLPPLLPELPINQHLLITVIQPSCICTIVKLFGHISWIYLTSREDIPALDGEVVLIDASSGVFICYSHAEAILRETKLSDLL